MARQPADAEPKGQASRGRRGVGGRGRGRGRTSRTVEVPMADTAVGVAPPGGSPPVAWAAVATASLEERARPQVSPERATEAAQEAESSAESSPVEVVAVPASSRGKRGGGKPKPRKERP